MKKTHEIIAKCIALLDPTVKVTFCPITAGGVILDQRNILLPDWREELYSPLMTALHELAHIWYSNLVTGENLNQEEREALRWVEDSYVDYRFCKDFPEFHFDFLKTYLKHQEEFRSGGGTDVDSEFWYDLAFTAWDRGKCDGLAMSLLGGELILELKEAIVSATSTIDLIPVVKKVVLKAREKDIKTAGSSMGRFIREVEECERITFEKKDRC